MAVEVGTPVKERVTIVETSTLPEKQTIEQKEQLIDAQLQGEQVAQSLKGAGPQTLKAQPTQKIEFEGEVHEFPMDFTDEDIAVAFGGTPKKETKTFVGKGAIKQVEALEGALTDSQKHLVTLEGYVDGEYKDIDGNSTKGVGQTGKFAGMTFKESYKAHVKRVQSRVSTFTTLPQYLQQELIQAEYRGDWANSPKTLGLINSGEWAKAAAEFLDSDDYRDSLADGHGIDERMEMVHDALLKYGEEVDAKTKADADKSSSNMSPSKGGLFEDENGVLFLVDENGKKTEV
jgi:hypothetical protein